MSNIRTIAKLANELVAGDVIVGDNGGFSAITGEVYESNVMHGFFAVETEHGTLYLADDDEIEYLVLAR